MADSDAVERGRETRDRDLEHASPDPARLEPAVREHAGADAREDEQADEHQGTVEPARIRGTTLRTWVRGDVGG
jgi:hypothetical protein